MTCIPEVIFYGIRRKPSPSKETELGNKPSTGPIQDCTWISHVEMNVGKPSVSPPVQITQQQARNIVVAPPQRGHTPPIRTDYTGKVEQQHTAYSIQQGFSAHPHDMNKQAVTSGSIPQPGITPQSNIYRQVTPQYYTPTQQQTMRPRTAYMGNPQGNAQMYPMVYLNNTAGYPANQAGLLYQPQMFQGQRMQGPSYTIPNNVQQQYASQYQNPQYAAPSNQQQYIYYPQQQQQQQTQPMPVTQTRPSSAPIQTQPPVKRERNPITIVDPTTRKDVTAEILHKKSTPPSSTGTPVSFPVSNSPQSQQDEICAQFASQVAARIRSQPPKSSSTPPGGLLGGPDGTSQNQEILVTPEIPPQTFEPTSNQQPITMASGDVMKGETSVDPPSYNSSEKVPVVVPVVAAPQSRDTITFEPNEYNVNIPVMQKPQHHTPKSVVVSANLDNVTTERELPPSRSEPVAISQSRTNITPKTASVSAQNLTESSKPTVNVKSDAPEKENMSKKNTPSAPPPSKKPQPAEASVKTPQTVSTTDIKFTGASTVVETPKVKDFAAPKVLPGRSNVDKRPSPVVSATDVVTETKTEIVSEVKTEIKPEVKKEVQVEKTQPKAAESIPDKKPEVTIREQPTEINRKSASAEREQPNTDVKTNSVSSPPQEHVPVKEEVKIPVKEKEKTPVKEETPPVKVEVPVKEKTPVREEKIPVKEEKTVKPEEAPVKVVNEENVPQAVVKQAPVVTDNSTDTKQPTVTTDNKDEEGISRVEIKIEDTDVTKENAKNTEMTTEALTNSQPKKTEPQYKYKPDQWSPDNLEGKKMYDRDFLLQLQFANISVSKPQGLPNLPDIILEQPHQQSKLNDMGNVRDFTPDFFNPMQGGRTGSSHMVKKRNSQQGPRQEPKKIIKNLSISLDIKLHKAEKAWEPGRKQEKVAAESEDAEEEKTQEIYKVVKSILNKLTPQKFQTLLKQMTELSIDSEMRLKGVTDLIFEKAVSEPSFSVAYANMCRYLMQLKVPSGTKPGEMVNFRGILLTKCQREFEKDKDVELDLEARQVKINNAESEEVKKQLLEEKDVAETAARRRSIGNIRFIGELFKLKMLTASIMHDCVFKLLKSRNEENLECLCRLLTTIGKDLDEPKAKVRIDQYFEKMLKIVNEKKTSSRVRFMLQDVVDLRLCKWVPRREDNNPKTIDQIHEEAAKESAQKAYLLSQNIPTPSSGRDGRQNSRDGRSRGGPPNRGSQNNQRTDDGWNTVSSKPLRSIDLSKMKITKTTVDDNIQLGPGSRFGVWGRGSSGGGHGGTKSSSQEGESPAANAPANRFSGLRANEEDRAFGRGVSPARSDSRNRLAGIGRGRLTPRSSQELDRERAIANVRSIAGGRTTPSSNPASREGSRTRVEQRVEKPDPSQAKLLSDMDMEKKTKTIVDEYLQINDIKEACTCVSEINHPSKIHLFVEFSINHVLERSSKSRQQTGHLHHELINRKIITVDAYLKGVNQTLAEVVDNDMEIDIPKIWKYLGELVGPLIQDGCVPLSFLKQVCQPLAACGKSGVLVAEVLHDASQRLGHKIVASLWKNSGLSWTDFVSADDVKQFLMDKDLEFTVAGDSQPTTPVDKVSFETTQEQLLVRLRDENCDNEHIFDWIEANIPDETTKCSLFIRTLMTAVCKSAINESQNYKVSKEAIKQRRALLIKYIDNKQQFEIQALYALQALVNELQHPQGVLRTFFEIIYDEDIISDNAFHQWSSSTDPAEQEGKGVAMKSVNQFFAWLKEGEQDES